MNVLNNIFKNPIGLKQNKPMTKQQKIQHMVRQMTDGSSPNINPKYLPNLYQITNSIDDCGEIISAIVNSIDHNCDSPIVILKLLKLVYLFLIHNHETCCPAVQAFTPELQTLLHLSFQI